MSDSDERAQQAHTQQAYEAGALREQLLMDAPALVAYLRGRLPAAAADTPLSTMSGREAAVLAPFYALAGRPHLLFTRRTTQLRRHSGEISLPGGSRDPGDDTLLTTALRESREELALDVTRIEPLGALEPVFAAVSDFLVTPFVGWLGEGAPHVEPNPAEVAEVIYAPLDALADPAIFHEEIWRRGGVEHTIYFFDLGPHRIWGLTGRIVRSLLALLPADPLPPM
jgi:8-oxo-dGTP pyrophosphatase MutT (NUDIX family)